MNTNTIERLILGLGAILLIGYVASIFIESMKSMQDNFRLAAIAGIVCYAGYSFWVQSNDQKQIFSRDQKLEKLIAEIKKERRRGDDLQESHLSLQSQLNKAQNQVTELKEKLIKRDQQNQPK